MLIRKEVIRPGAYTYIHPDSNKPEILEITPDLIQHFHTQGQAMLSAGLAIPVPLEHQLDAKPVSTAEKAAKTLRHNAGWVKSYAIDKLEENGKKIDNVLFAELDIEDEDIIKKLPKTIKYTSPWINSFVDGSGKAWNGVISHLALTLRPRIVGQQPFGHNMAAALSLLESLSPIQKKSQDITGSFSVACLLNKKHKPKFPLDFSAAFNIKLAKDDLKSLKDEIGEDDDEAPKPKEPGPELEPEPKPDLEVPPTPIKTNDLTIEEAIGNLLKAMGIMLPEFISPDSFMRELYDALTAKVTEIVSQAQIEKEKDEFEEPETPNQGAEMNPIVEEKPVMFSAENIKAITDPEKRRFAEMLFSLQKENERNRAKLQATTKAILDEAEQKRRMRLERIGKRLPVAKRDMLFSLAQESPLSLDDNGKIKDSLSKALEIMESAVLDIPSLLLNPSGAQEQDHPSNGELTDERRKQIVEEFARNCGYSR